MEKPNIVNTVVDEANCRKYVVMAPRVLTDGEIYSAIRQDLLRRGGKQTAHGTTLTLTLTPKGGILSSVESATGSDS